MIEIDFFLDIFWKCLGNMPYFILYLGCLLYLGRYGSKLMKQIFVWPFVILLVTVYNPLVMGFVLGMTDWSDRYYRFFWLMPVGILYAYMFATIIDKQQRKDAKFAIVLLVACMVLLCGNTQIKEVPDENIYKMDDYILELSELIEEEKTADQPVVVFDRNVYYQIRQYDATILMAVNNVEMTLYGEKMADELDSEEQYLDQGHAAGLFVRGVEVDANLVNEIFEERNAEFFVRNVDYYSDEYIQSLNLSYVGEVDGYEVYRCMH